MDGPSGIEKGIKSLENFERALSHVRNRCDQSFSSVGLSFLPSVGLMEWTAPWQDLHFYVSGTRRNCNTAMLDMERRNQRFVHALAKYIVFQALVLLLDRHQLAPNDIDPPLSCCLCQHHARRPRCTHSDGVLEHFLVLHCINSDTKLYGLTLLLT